MNAPNRAADVRALCAGHRDAFGPPDETNDARRLAFLREWLIPALNLLDGGKWGGLRKDDQGGKRTCDVIVWADTREHFDVLTGTGPTWIPHGVLSNPAWVWEAVGTAQTPISEPPAPPSGPTDPSAILAALSRTEAALVALESRMAALAAKVPPITTTYSGRIGPFVVVLRSDLPK